MKLEVGGCSKTWSLSTRLHIFTFQKTVIYKLDPLKIFLPHCILIMNLLTGEANGQRAAS
jgi:hypothetical protein